jgi:transketolase C-terminal domain/subunit
VIGGLGSAVGEILLKHNINNIMVRSIGIPDRHIDTIGAQSYLRKYYKIDENSIYKQIIRCLRR